MTQQHAPRRPAILTPQQAEAIIGDTDPAAYSELAHVSAWALMGLTDPTFPDNAHERIRDFIANAGVDHIAELWSRSPEFTLPGALWRTYLFAQWAQRDNDTVAQRFTQGEKTLQTTTSRYLTPNFDEVIEQTTQLFAGKCTEDDLENIFTNVATTMLTIANGTTSQWINDTCDPLAYTVSTRAHALITTATELLSAAHYAGQGLLD